MIHAATRDGHVRIEVTDDGPGFDANVAPAGHGLALVRDRLSMTLGDRASLDVDSRPGRTRVTVSVPSNDAPRLSKGEPS